MADDGNGEQLTVRGSGGVRLSVQDHGGDGPTVVLVHGYPDDHHVWDLVVDDLVADHRVVTYDVRGAGGSEAPTTTPDYLLEHLVADLAAVVDAVSPDAAVHLVGHDWGSVQAWSAVVDASVSRRFASYTTMSGPGLDHVANWFVARRRGGLRGWGQAAWQGLHSWYIVAFHTPLAPLMFRSGVGRRWAKVVTRLEPVIVDDRWPGADITADALNGMHLYRANIFPKLRRPGPVHTDVPVQLVIARRDPYVGPHLFDGIEEIASDLTRVEVDGKHWLPRSHAKVVAGLVRDHVRRVGARADR